MTFRTLRTLALLALPLLAACEDSPTAPASYAQEVAGATWVAVSEPAGMPSAELWLPYASPEAAREARALSREGARARRGGRIAEALELEARALLATAAGVERAPPAARVELPLSAVEGWLRRADERLAAAPHGHLAESARTVRARSDAARAALAEGDTAGALRHLAEAAVAAREHAPMAVGARLLAALEARLDGAAPGGSTQRARHLLAGAREGLATGDTVRALRRVVYAHQLLDARTEPVDSAAPRR